MDKSKERGLRLLSLGALLRTSRVHHRDPDLFVRVDGGGIRGLSSLSVLQSILLAVQAKLNLPKVPLPCEIFDLIGGTSTGG